MMKKRQCPSKRHDGQRLNLIETSRFGTLLNPHRITGMYRHRPRDRYFDFVTDGGRVDVLCRDSWFINSETRRKETGQ